jgi:adenosylcobinamide-phosphate synthase
VTTRALAVAGGLAADALFGEPPARSHPVRAFGSIMRIAERRLYRDSRVDGVAHAGLGVALAVGTAAVVRSTAVTTYFAVAGRALGDTALEVARALEDGDLDRGRALLPALVGRDPTGLDEAEIARAVVESVAENTVDAVVAPAFWAVALGAPGALGYRAVNTLDAMVGHRGDRYGSYGWASARLDDAANLVPARLTAALVAGARPRRAGEVWHTVHRDARGHPSPNSGVAEAAFAAALGVRLGGTNRYGDRHEVRPFLGRGRPAAPADIARCVQLSRHVTILFAALLVGGGLVWTSR